MKPRHRLAIGSAVTLAAGLALGLSALGQPASARPLTTSPLTTTPPAINCLAKNTLVVTWRASGVHQLSAQVPSNVSLGTTTSTGLVSEPLPFGTARKSREYAGYVRRKGSKTVLLGFAFREDAKTRQAFQFSLGFQAASKHTGSARIDLSDHSSLTIPAANIGSARFRAAKAHGWTTGSGTGLMGASGDGGAFATKIAFSVCLK